MQICTILGVPFSAITRAEALSVLLGFLQADANHIVVTPNPEAVMLSRRNPVFANALQQAALVLADGIGILLAARWKRLPLPERVPGCDISQALLDAAPEGTRVFFLGAAPGVAEAAARRTAARCPQLNIVGARDGFFAEADTDEVVACVNQAAPDILLVGMGMPRQERFATQLKDALNCRVTLCVGGTLDVMAGTVRRAPVWMRRVGLEWFYRLVSQPSRAKRMLDLPRFLWAVMTHA